MADIHKVTTEPSEEELEMMGELMLGFLFPNTPRTKDEKAAFEKAVKYQLNHDKTVAEASAEVVGAVQQGVKSFRIGEFSMSFGSSTTNHLTRKTICPYAYSVLLRAGLLYKGLERGCDYGVD